MKRPIRLGGIAIAAALALATCLAPAALGAGPLTQRVSFVGTWETQAGDVCDFAYTQSWNDVITVITWGDPENPTRTLGAGPVRITHTNTDTGKTLIERDAWIDKIDFVSGTEMQAGITWHLMDTRGKTLFVGSGRVVFNLADHSIVSITPNMNVGFADVICPALGGSPA